MNINKLEQLKKDFNEKRNRNGKSLRAHFNFDISRPLTTNRKQLEMIDVDTNVDYNFYGIIDALAMINVKVFYRKIVDMEIVKAALDRAIDDEVTERWGGDQMVEILDLTANL